MKSIYKLFILFFLASIALSCSEDDVDFPEAAAIKIINLIEGTDNLIVKTGHNPIDYATVSDGAKVGFETSKNFNISSNMDREVVIVAESDTLNTLFSETLNIKGTHSLYFSGTLDDVETLLVADNYKQLTDSVVGIRFVNLSKGVSGPINIIDQTTGSTIVSGLEYRSLTDYIEFSASEADGNYTFEFEDSLGNVLTIPFSFNPLDQADVSVKRNITLAITEYDNVTPFGTYYLYRISRFNNY